jgi:hypothetical protein
VSYCKRVKTVDEYHVIQRGENVLRAANGRLVLTFLNKNM